MRMGGGTRCAWFLFCGKVVSGDWIGGRFNVKACFIDFSLLDVSWRRSQIRIGQCHILLHGQAGQSECR